MTAVKPSGLCKTNSWWKKGFNYNTVSCEFNYRYSFQSSHPAE